MASRRARSWARWAPDGVADAEITVSAQCRRVPVIDGHPEAVSVRLTSRASARRTSRRALRVVALAAGRPGPATAPERRSWSPTTRRFPQPRRHVHLGDGMTVSVGRVQAARPARASVSSSSS